MLEMKKIRSKKLFGELVSELRPFMNEDGIEVLDYFGDPENIAAFKLGELKEDLEKAIIPANFTNIEDYLDVAQNIGIKVEGLDTEIFDAEVLEKANKKASKKEAKSSKKADKTPKKEAKKEAEKDLTPAEIVKLVGYRYTRPEFPEVLKSDMLGDYTLERVDCDFKKLEELDIDNLIVATFFSDKDSETYVDPNFISEKSYKELLQEKGLQHFPNNLDLAQIYHIDADYNSLMYVSLITGIPYVTSCKGKYAKIDKTLHCRMNTFGHDFAIYKAEAKKKNK